MNSGYFPSSVAYEVFIRGLSSHSANNLHSKIYNYILEESEQIVFLKTDLFKLY